MRTDKIRAERLNRFKLNNEGVALIYALMAGTVAMVFCLMLLMVSYSLYTQVSGNNSSMQLRYAAETFSEALRADLEEADTAKRSSMAKYISDELNRIITTGTDAEKKNGIELVVYDQSMGNYCIYTLISYDTELTTVPSQIDLDVTVRSIKGVPYTMNGDNYVMIDEGSDSSEYTLDNSASYTIKDTYTMRL